ncbi:DUF1838 family protein [Phenylobacterium sp.]|uniref:DUF1838 family protein n=1 Tax=Phenylobacterium sp. TaxID=1871053 RepID=UPI0025F92A56|nr:DUF1838 family protein [Phenylobacterium sp.]
MSRARPARRDLLGLIPVSLALCASALVSAPAAAAQTPGLRTWLKLVADLDGRTVFSVTEGMVWGFKPQADDLTAAQFARRLYGYRSLLARKVETTPDGLRLRTKGWSFYLDADSGEPVSELLNPYTGLKVTCPPLSGPASSVTYGGPVATGAGPDLTMRRIGDHAWIGVDRISRFKPSDTTWFKLEADLTTYACRTADLDNPANSHIPSTWSHSLTAEWQTWMRMHGEPGHILFNGAGVALRGPEQIGTDLRRAIDRGFPGALAETLAWG